MKIFLLFLLLAPFTAFSQQLSFETVDAEDAIIEVTPSFPGGKVALSKYISRVTGNASQDNAPAESHVQLKFVVEKTGKITGTKISKSLDPKHDERALRMIEKMPPWIPATDGVKPIRVAVTMAVVF